MRKLEFGLVGAAAVIVLACDLDAQLALTGNTGGAPGTDNTGGIDNAGGTVNAGGIDNAGGSVQATGGNTTNNFERASVLVANRYPECTIHITEANPQVKNGIVGFDCGAAASGPAYYLYLESGELISNCGGACMSADGDQLRVCQTMCPPPAFGDCASASSSTAELPQCRAIDFCLADSVAISETEGLFQCEATDDPEPCKGSSDRQTYIYSSDRIELRFSVDRSLVGQFAPGPMWADVDLESVVLRFPDQSRLLSEVDPEAFAYGEVERADIFAVVAMSQEVSAQAIDYTADGKLHIWVAVDGDRARFRTSSSNYEACWTDDMLGICECSYEKSIVARIDLKLPVESEL